MSRKLIELGRLVSQEDVALWERTRVLFRRLTNEGIGPFVGSMFFLTTGLICVTLYYTSTSVLDNAVTREMISVLGSPQEPSDISEMGLIATALAKINALPESGPRLDAGSDCEDAFRKANCDAFQRYYKHFETQIRKAHASGGANGMDETDGQGFFTEPPDISKTVRPEVREGIECFMGRDGMGGVNPNLFVLLPAQSKDAIAQYPSRGVKAWHESSILSEAIASGAFPEEPGVHHLVQAYFITPDSVLRIWTIGGTNICKEFSPTRLWASKGYFDHFWSHSGVDKITQTYIDYGGHGLVRTLCRDIETPPQAVFNRRLDGVLCADFKIPSELFNAELYRHLLLQTADVHIRLPITDNSVEVAMYSIQNSTDGAAFSMLSLTGQPSERDIRDAIDRSIRSRDPDRLKREITRVLFPDGKRAGFLLPLGLSRADVVHAVFFFPRYPRLPWVPYRLYAIVGYSSLGIFACSLVYGYMFRTKADELRERQSLLRNLQVGVVQVDTADWILESNDRAEELFGRRLSKYGSMRLKINFNDLLDKRVERTEDWDPERRRFRFRETTKEKIAELRRQSKASSYYARLRQPAKAAAGRKWLLVAATPMMLAVQGRNKPDEATLENVFATIVPAAPETLERLNEEFGDD